MRRTLAVILILVHGLLAGCALLRGNTLVSGSVLFEEQFVPGETGNWLTETDEVGETAIIDGRLIIDVNTPNTAQYSALQDPFFDDFVAEVDVMQLEGSLNNSYGIIFRMRSPNEFYRFEITGNGMYLVEKRLATGEWVRLGDGWTESAAIIRGLSSTNRLRVVADGPLLTFFINNQQIVQITDSQR